MKDKTWCIAHAVVACIAALLVGTYALTAPSEDVSDEAALIAVLKSDAGWMEKHAACRALRQVGTAASVPALAALLPDETLSHMARYALEPMPCPEAGQALRVALTKTEGMPKAGVIISIGVRRDAEAVPLLTPLLNDSNVDVARAAVGALGRIATPEAAAALMDFRDTAPETLRPALAEGLLAAGQTLTGDGKGELAAPIFQDLLGSAWPMYVRMGALRGAAYALPDQTSTVVLTAMLGSGQPPVFRDVAAQIIAETSGESSTRAYAEALAKAPADVQVALLRGLAGRGDPAARPEVARCLGSPDAPVRLTAVKALGTLGGVEDVNVLVGLLTSEDAEMADAAKIGLAAMQGGGVNSAIAGAVPNAAPSARGQLLEILTSRKAEQAVPSALQSLKDADVSVRIASLRVLAVLGGKEQAPVVVAAVLHAADTDERAAAEKALSAVCSRSGDAVLPVLLDAMRSAEVEARVVLLRAIALVGGPKALETVLLAAGESGTPVGDEAVRLLSEWPSLDAAPHLLDLARSDDLNRQVLGLRGYVRLAGLAPSAEEKGRMLANAMELAKRPDEKKIVLGAWGSLASEQSFDALRPYLDNAAVQNEAALAIIAVAAELGKTNEACKPRAIEALNTIIEKCSDATVRERAQEVLAALQ